MWIVAGRVSPSVQVRKLKFEFLERKPRASVLAHADGEVHDDGYPTEMLSDVRVNIGDLISFDDDQSPKVQITTRIRRVGISRVESRVREQTSSSRVVLP